MTTVGEIMTPAPEAVGTHHDLVVAAHRMRTLDVGALPVTHRDGRLAGIVTDRDIVVHCVADGTDPRTVDAGGMTQDPVVTVGAEAGATVREISKNTTTPAGGL